MLEQDRFGSLAESEGARAAEEELEEFKPPRDLARQSQLGLLKGGSKQ